MNIALKSVIVLLIASASADNDSEGQGDEEKCVTRVIFRFVESDTCSAKDDKSSSNGLDTAKYPPVELTEISNGKSYYDSDELLDWFDAYDFCRHRGLNLASTPDEESFKSLNARIMEIGKTKFTKCSYGDVYNCFWTGGNDLQKEGEWHWATIDGFNEGPYIPNKTNNTLKGFSIWQSGNPDNYAQWGDVENCMQLWSVPGDKNKTTTYNDISCRVKLKFFCEAPAKLADEKVTE